jgi:molybdopterin-guanine dinucleotide biosynthesis protein A
MNDDSKYFDFLIDKYPNIQNLKCYLIDDVYAISSHINRLIEEETAPVQALILKGGKSTRMGTDKSLLKYYGQPQSEYLYEQFSKIFLHYNETQKGVYYSVSKQQDINQNFITDKFKGLGPFGGICSAFMENPNTAWFVIATDVPYVNLKMIHSLLKHRNPKKIATAFKGKDSEFPEPLITIWEPKAYPILLSYLSQGYSCPRKVLINSDVEIVEVDNHYIQNINTPEEFEKAKNELKK